MLSDPYLIAPHPSHLQVLQSPDANSIVQRAVLAAQGAGVLPALPPSGDGTMVPVVALSYARSVFSHNGPRKMVCTDTKKQRSLLVAARAGAG